MQSFTGFGSATRESNRRWTQRDLVALPGISLMLVTCPNNTGKTQACKGVLGKLPKTKISVEMVNFKLDFVGK